MLRGGKVTRSSRSLGRNLGSSIQLVRRIHDESAVYSTGETWGLPMALTGALLPRRRFTHVVYVHRVFSSAWLGFLHATRHLLAVDGWICVTQHQAELLRNTFGEGGKPVAVVSQGVDTAFFDSNKASPAQGRPYLLAVGVEMRNYGLLFDAVRDLDIDVVVKASSAWMAASRSEITSVPANVALITRRLSHIELRDLYAGAALVVVPLYDTSQAAGITAILEGMAMQKCVVATRSRGLPDILVQNQTGVICEPSAGVLADNLAQLLAAPEQREALGNCGRNAVIAKASVEQYAKQITDFVISVSDGQAT
jgi:glycosyltransferase involved in cell wall biosynthesis